LPALLFAVMGMGVGSCAGLAGGLIGRRILMKQTFYNRMKQEIKRVAI